MKLVCRLALAFPLSEDCAGIEIEFEIEKSEGEPESSFFPRAEKTVSYMVQSLFERRDALQPIADASCDAHLRLLKSGQV